MISKMEEHCGAYLLKALPQKRYNDRYSVRVSISRIGGKPQDTRVFSAEDRIWYILDVEAAIESINLGKHLIKNNLVGF